jgi:hypothetical protein
LGASAFPRGGCEKVALVTNPDVDPLLKVVEEVNTFPNQRDFIRVVELEPKRSGRNRRSERG